MLVGGFGARTTLSIRTAANPRRPGTRIVTNFSRFCAGFDDDETDRHRSVFYGVGCVRRFPILQSVASNSLIPSPTSYPIWCIFGFWAVVVYRLCGPRRSARRQIYGDRPLSPLYLAASQRTWTRIASTALVGCLLASLFTLISSVGIAPQAGAQISTNGTVAQLRACENGAATIEVYLDNRGVFENRAVKLTIGPRITYMTAFADSENERKFEGIPDGDIPVIMDFGGDEVRTAVLSIECKAQLGMPSAKAEFGCVSGAGYATFTLTNPTNHEVKFTVDTVGRKPGASYEGATEVLTVPSRQNRTVNFLNLSDSSFRFDVSTPDDRTDGFYGTRVYNHVAPYESTCSADDPRHSAEPYHVVTTTCEGTSGVVRLHTGQNPKPTTVRVGTNVKSNFLAGSQSEEDLITGVTSGMYDVTVQAGATSANFQDRPIDCASRSYEGEYVSRAEIKNSCLVENGRIDAYIYNESSQAKTYYLKFPGLVARSRTVGAGQNSRLTITGRPDGDFTAIVRDQYGTKLAISDLTVDCDPLPNPAFVRTSCLAGNGRVDVYLANLTDTIRIYEISVGHITREKILSRGEDGRITVTGRRDGDLEVVVRQTNVPIFTETIKIACD